MQAIRASLARRASVIGLPPQLLVYWLALFAASTAVVFALLWTGAPTGSPLVLAVLAVASALAERGTVRLTRTLEVSVAALPGLFAAVVFGPFAAMIVSAASMLFDLRPPAGTPHPLLKWSTYTMSRALTGAATGLAAATASEFVANPIGSVTVATGAAALVSAVLDVCFVSLTIKFRGSGKLTDGVRVLGPVVVASVPLYMPVVAFLAYAYSELSPWTLPLFLAPALAAQRLFILYQDQRRLADDLIAANEQLERANISFAAALVATLDARDRYTAGHSAAVAVYARDIAKRMGLPVEHQRLAHLCGLVHDIGKVGLPPGLLEKRGPLNLRERRQMEQHSVIGERILAKLEEYSEVATIVRHHHERVDGHGYPDGLSGDDIPLISRIIAVADAYDAMTSDRPYRDAMPSRVARLRLAQAVESQFDTAVVAAFEAILAGEDDDYRVGRHARTGGAAATVTLGDAVDAYA